MDHSSPPFVVIQPDSSTSCKYEQPHKILLILDYDDTLHPSTFFDRLCVELNVDSTLELRQIEHISPYHVSILSDIESAVLSYIDYALADDISIVVITNAQQGWVQSTCPIFFPRLWPRLRALPIISAREHHERDFPMNPAAWKYHAMRNVVSDFNTRHADPDINIHYISFGDSHIDKDALKRVKQDYVFMIEPIFKTIKFASCPSLEKLYYQWCFLWQSFDYVLKHSGNLDVIFS
jgi:hypothetical protein